MPGTTRCARQRTSSSTTQSDLDPATGAPAPDYSTETDAGDIAAYAEQAYAAYRSWGYRGASRRRRRVHRHLPHGSHRTAGGRVVLEPERRRPGPRQRLLHARDDALELQAFAALSPASRSRRSEQQEIALNVFHLFQIAVWTPTTGSDLWLFNGPATWAAFQRVAVRADEPHREPRHRPRLQREPRVPPTGCATPTCTTTPASRAGRSSTSSRRSTATPSSRRRVRQRRRRPDQHDRARERTGRQGDDVSRRSTPISSTVSCRAPSARQPSRGLRPPSYANVPTGAAAVSTATTVAFVPANHLAARYVTFQRGDGDGAHACYAATLSINVLDAGRHELPAVLLLGHAGKLAAGAVDQREHGEHHGAVGHV